MHYLQTIFKHAIFQALFFISLGVVSSTVRPASLDEVQSEVFSSACALSGCHDGTQAPDLSSGRSYSETVNVAATLMPSLSLVNPGNADASFLVQKMEGTGIGSPMPLTGLLQVYQIQLVRDWINAGATESDTSDPDTGTDADADADADADNDGDGIGNSEDPDDDNDGISDHAELSVGLDPLDTNDVTGSPREIVWRNKQSGDNVLWSMESQHRIERNTINKVADPNWIVVGMSDFTGNGIDEILFRNSATGSNRLWTIEDGKRISSDSVMGAATEWLIVTIGDGDSDGDADLFWRNQVTGDNRYWEMEGTNRLSSLPIRSVPLSWSVTASGDFDGDGRQDLLWRNDSGANVIWLMDGEVRTDRGELPSINSTWNVVDVADFDGDGMDDILWHNPETGSNSIWLISGASRKGRGSLPGTSDAWTPFAAYEMNGDGYADILFRNHLNGANRLWLMNATTRLSSLEVKNVADQNWVPVAVGNTSNVEGFPITLNESQSSEAISFFDANISSSIIQSRCIVCHIDGGVAATSALRYSQSETNGYRLDNFTLLRDHVLSGEENANLFLAKVRGVSHGGGVQLSPDSTDYQNLVQFLTLIGGEIDPVNSQPLSQFWQGISLASAPQTLRRAALIVGGRLPTDEELLAVNSSDDAALRSAIRNLMQGDNFHDFLITGANDRLFTDAFLNGLGFELSDLNSSFYPLGANKQFFDRPETDEAQDTKYHWQNQWRWGLARAPLELIAYIVMNDRSYQEVVTADYMMVNIRTSEILNSGVEFETNDHRIYKPGENRGQIIRDDQLVSTFDNEFGTNVTSHGGFIDYPHAGVLNSQAFLNRYPTTETNRNRARSRWTMFHFLGFDIEKSAKRTTDPEALADTDNPTLNNPACTVCHIIFDPISGTYQNYGNEGYYRDQWGGTDSLPDTYKHPEWFDDDAEPSQYLQGDTWYRDMLTPGFEDQLAPDPADSLAWVAVQISDNPDFATAAIKFWWPALMGADVLVAPEAVEDVDFQQSLAAFEEQNSFIESLGASFSTGINGGQPFNGKDLLTEMMMSPWFRASRLASSDVNGTAALVSDHGAYRLLTPLELEQKSSKLLGWTWGEYENVWQYDGTWSSLTDRYGIYYGGIDSNGIKARSRALTPLMANVAEKQALEMACPAVVSDFNRSGEDRLLFDGIEKTTTPVSEFSESFNVIADDFSNRQTYSANGRLTAGEATINISFRNDYYDEAAGDRNLYLDSLAVVDGSGSEVLQLELGDIENVEGSTVECGGTRRNPDTGTLDNFIIWSNCTISIPFEVVQMGNYEFDVIAWGQQAGPDTVVMEIGLTTNSPVDGNSAGAIAIKNKLIQLHQKLLGETLEIDDEELEASYLLLVETWQERTANPDHTWAWSWPDENCYFYQDDPWGEDGPASTARDPSGMLNAWTSILIYLMTDFRYLHE